MMFYPARYNDKLIALMAGELGVDFLTLKEGIIQIETEIEKKIKSKKEGKNERE